MVAKTAWQRNTDATLAEIRRRIDQLQDRPAQTRPPRNVRLAITCRDPDTGDYPTILECPNTYWIVFVDGSFAEETDGDVPHALKARQDTDYARTTAHNIWDGEDAYCPINTLIRVSFHNGQWWFVHINIADCTSSTSTVSVSIPSSSEVSSSAAPDSGYSSSAPASSAPDSGYSSSAPASSSAESSSAYSSAAPSSAPDSSSAPVSSSAEASSSAPASSSEEPPSSSEEPASSEGPAVSSSAAPASSSGVEVSSSSAASGAPTSSGDGCYDFVTDVYCEEEDIVYCTRRVCFPAALGITVGEEECG